ncbi:MAG: cupin domain-containing protein [Gemmatimonadota bacterium]
MNADTLPEWAAFGLQELSSERADSGRPYLPFLDVKSMSMGLYELGAGATDGQQPHARDEVYVVMSGRAVLSVAGEDTPVGPGSVVFVAALVDHRFHSIDEPLSVLVLFAGDTD